MQKTGSCCSGSVVLTNKSIFFLLTLCRWCGAESRNNTLPPPFKWILLGLQLPSTVIIIITKVTMMTQATKRVNQLQDGTAACPVSGTERATRSFPPYLPLFPSIASPLALGYHPGNPVLGCSGGVWPLLSAQHGSTEVHQPCWCACVCVCLR